MSAPALVRPERGPGLRGRARRNRVGIVAVIAFVALLTFMAVTAASTDTIAMSTKNATGGGARALAQILDAQGVEVRQIERLNRARIADPSRTTVAVIDPGLLTSGQLASLADYPGDLLLLGAGDTMLEALGVDARTTFGALGGTAPAGCDDPDAAAAGRISVSSEALTDAGPGTTLCFTARDGAASFARTEADGRTITVVTAVGAFTNALLDQEGNAALALRVAGRHPELVWYIGSGLDPTLLTWTGATTDGGEAPSRIDADPDFLPPGTGTALYALALALVVAAVWRGRRFGPLVREPLPVEVRASEATRGRARLYRRVRASGRAGAALRASAALRMGRRIGVPRTASREALVDALARATCRSEADLIRILYGAPPADDAALLTLTQELDTLEREVHRP